MGREQERKAPDRHKRKSIEKKSSILVGSKLKHNNPSRHRRRNRSNPNRRLKAPLNASRKTSRFLRHANRNEEKYIALNGGGRRFEPATKFDQDGGGFAGEGLGLGVWEIEDGDL